MKFTHDLDTNLGWIETTENPSNFEKVKHLGKCAIDGDMFAVYDDGSIHIFKGTMEDEKTLKTNTWYISNVGLFVYRTGNEHNYGFNSEEESDDCICRNYKIWTEATDKEVEEALIKVAKKKGFKNIDKLRIKDFDGKVYGTWMFGPVNNTYLYSNGKLSLDGVVIFRNGKWIEILEDKPSLEDRITNLENKIEQDRLKLDKILNMVEYNTIKK